MRSCARCRWTSVMSFSPSPLRANMLAGMKCQRVHSHVDSAVALTQSADGIGWAAFGRCSGVRLARKSLAALAIPAAARCLASPTPSQGSPTDKTDQRTNQKSTGLETHKRLTLRWGTSGSTDGSTCARGREDGAARGLWPAGPAGSLPWNGEKFRSRTGHELDRGAGLPRGAGRAARARPRASGRGDTSESRQRDRRAPASASS